MLIHCRAVANFRDEHTGVVLAPVGCSVFLQDWELEMLNGSLVHLLLPLAEELLFIR